MQLDCFKLQSKAVRWLAGADIKKVLRQLKRPPSSSYTGVLTCMLFFNFFENLTRSITFGANGELEN